MSRPCPNCGALCAKEARFCRLCGTPLRVANGNAQVSPGAATVPLTDEGRTTNGFPTEDGQASAPDTSRVRRAEMENILRRSAQAQGSPSEDGSAPVLTSEEEEASVTTAIASSASVESASDLSSSSDTESEETVDLTPVVRHDPTQSVTASTPPKKSEGGGRRVWQLTALALLVVAVGATALAFYYSRRSAAERDAKTGAPISISDQQRVVEEKLSEAETLLASGNVTDAMARLRYAIRLDPTNARAHRLLAEALERTGAVNEAIDEYRAATQYDPNNEETLMRYADALRRVGRTDEAREIYQKLSASSSAEKSRTAKEQLAVMPPAQSSNTEAERNARSQNRAEEASTTPASSSSTQPNSSTVPPNSTGKGKNDPVASYNKAMQIIEGKDIRKMNRADLINAYELFQYAQSGPHAADATRHLRELDKELFERRKRK